MEDLSGKQLGRYQVIAPLGEGGMAAVYKAYQPGMERYVALKILPQAYARDPEFTGRFEQEAKVIAKLQHPHILPVHDFGEAESYTYIVMPLVDTGTLADLERGKRTLPLQRIRRITIQVGDALDYAHSQGLIHRDVKPSNILIDRRGNCLLTDFGIAKMVEGTKHFTQTGGIVGTPHYMAPEQGSGAELTPASDIYSLGVVIYEMATGRVPFEAETPMAVVIKHMHDPLPAPSSINQDIGPALEGLILKAMAKDPADRFRTAAELVEAMRDAVPERASSAGQGQITTVPAPELAEREAAARDEPSQPAEPAPEPQRRSLAPWIAVGGVVLLGLCGLGALGAYQLIGAGSDAAAAESNAATEAALLSQQQTAAAAQSTQTPTTAAPASTPVASPTAAAQPTAEPDRIGLPRGATAADLPGASWPIVLSESFDQNSNGWSPFQEFTDEFGTRSFSFREGKYHWEIDPSRDLNVHDNPDMAPLTDFFLSADLQQLSGPDSADYGVIFRRMSADSFYAFSLSDSRQYSFQLLQDGAWTTILDWTDSPLIQAGAVNRVAVSGQGDQFHFFINDRYVASAQDDRLQQGVVGFVIDMFDPGVPAEWTFDNLELRRPWEYSVVESFESVTGLWETGSNTFRDLTENLSVADGVYRWSIECENSEFGCISSTYLDTIQNATDFELSVEVRRLDGPTDAQYGVRFRDDGDNYLEFLISESGTFAVLLWYQQELDYYYLDSSSPAIAAGQVNRLTVSAEGSDFAFYINEVKVGEIVENLLPAGGFGLSASLSGAEQAAFEFDNFRLRQP